MKSPFFYLRFCVLAVVFAAPAAMWAQGGPVLTKTFGASTVPLNGTTTLSFTIAPSDSESWNQIGFSDTLPAGLVVATPNGLDISQCAGLSVTATAGSGTITVPVQSIAPASCTFTLNVIGIAVGLQSNTTSVLTIQNGDGQRPAASASVTVVGPPTISKAFGTSSIPYGASTSLTFTIANPSQLSRLDGVGFTDILPSGLVVSTPNGLTAATCGGGTITATAGSGSVALSGATLATIGGGCTFSVNVTGTSAGLKNNTTTAITSIQGGNGNTASASLTVQAQSVPLLSPAAFAGLALLLAGMGSLLARKMHSRA